MVDLPQPVRIRVPDELPNLMRLRAKVFADRIATLRAARVRWGDDAYHHLRRDGQLLALRHAASAVRECRHVAPAHWPALRAALRAFLGAQP